MYWLPVLLNKNIIDIPKYDVIGFHPTELPKIRWLPKFGVVLGIRLSIVFLIKDPNKPDNGELIFKEECYKNNYTSKDLC